MHNWNDKWTSWQSLVFSCELKLAYFLTCSLHYMFSFSEKNLGYCRNYWFFLSFCIFFKLSTLWFFSAFQITAELAQKKTEGQKELEGGGVKKNLMFLPHSLPPSCIFTLGENASRLIRYECAKFQKINHFFGIGFRNDNTIFRTAKNCRKWISGNKDTFLQLKNINVTILWQLPEQDISSPTLPLLTLKTQLYAIMLHTGKTTTFSQLQEPHKKCEIFAP